MAVLRPVFSCVTCFSLYGTISVWQLKLIFSQKNYSPLHSSVSCYTREAGVRTLERRIAAVCRAVAVKVLESHTNNKGHHKDGKEAEKDNIVKEQDKAEATAIVHPPEMPIVIDEAAVEDILGVCIIIFLMTIVN